MTELLRVYVSGAALLYLLGFTVASLYGFFEILTNGYDRTRLRDRIAARLIVAWPPFVFVAVFGWVLGTTWIA